MAECKSCGAEYEKHDLVCPSCGNEPGLSEQIIDYPSGVKSERKKLFEEIEEERERKRMIADASGACVSCGAKVHPEENICPSCGMVGGAETITDLPPLNLREKHRQLKEEIREAREQRKHE